MSLPHQTITSHAAVAREANSGSSGKSPSIESGVPTEKNAAERGGQSVAATQTRLSEVAADVSRFLTEAGRNQDEWRRMFVTMHETLVPLSRLCATAIDRDQSQAADVVSGLLDRLMGAAASDAQVAAQRARAEAESRIAELQAALVTVERELHTVGGQLQTANETLERERAAWVQTQSAWENTRREDDRLKLACQSQLRDLQTELETVRAEYALVVHQLESERAERSKLTSALAAVQRAVSIAESGSPAATVPDDPVSGSSIATVSSKGEASADREATLPAVVNRALTLVHNAERVDTDTGPLVEYATELLDTAEGAYWADLNDGTLPAAAVDRLTESLRNARDLFVRRTRSSGGDETTFKHQLMARLNSKSDNWFARHLAIAIYELYPTWNHGHVTSRAS
jgi:hypothetical protein